MFIVRTKYEYDILKKSRHSPLDYSGLSVMAFLFSQMECNTTTPLYIRPDEGPLSYYVTLAESPDIPGIYVDFKVESYMGSPNHILHSFYVQNDINRLGSIANPMSYQYVYGIDFKNILGRSFFHLVLPMAADTHRAVTAVAFISETVLKMVPLLSYTLRAQYLYSIINEINHYVAPDYKSLNRGFTDDSAITRSKIQQLENVLRTGDTRTYYGHTREDYMLNEGYLLMKPGYLP